MAESKWRIPPEPIPDDKITQVYEADLIVIGAGHAGTAATRAAAEAGASVICFDKQKDKQQWVLGFEIGTINSKLAKSRGIPEYDPLDFVREWQRRTLNRSNPALVMQFAKNCGPSLDWFIEPVSQDIIDNAYFFLSHPSEESKDNINGQYGFIGTCIFRNEDHHELELPVAVKQNQEYAKSLGAQFMWQMDAQYLTKDGDRVTGVIAQNRETKEYVQFKANKGVLLSAGDFGANEEMVRELCVEGIDLCDPEGSIRSNTWDGRGIQMGVWAGGRLEPRPLAGGNAMSGPPGCLGSTGGWVTLNANGKRFGDEGNFSARIQGNMQPYGKYACVWDANWRKQLARQGLDHGGLDPNMPEDVYGAVVRAIHEAPAAGAEGAAFKHPVMPPMRVYAAYSINTLADYLGYEGEAKMNFFNSIKHYNDMCVNGRDEDFAKDPHLMLPISEAPYFGMVSEKTYPVGGGGWTCGGLWTDEHQNVLNARLEPIEGLYASGNCCGNRFGFQYICPVGGVSIGMAMTMGRLVGDHIAKL
jgi:succinate dehydrogenase/fumarate reductase flavoprotein subunit